MEIGLLLIFCIFVYFKISPYLSADKIIQKWALDRNFTIENKEVRFVRSGPYFYQKNRAVFKVNLIDEKGVKKIAWIMIGHLFFLAPEKIVVKWESESDNSHYDNFNPQSIFLSIFYAASYFFVLFVLILLLLDFDIRGFLVGT
jgi:hypothetical protein